MRFSQKTRRSLAGGSLLLTPLLASPMLIDGCSSIIEGKPVKVPTGLSFPTPRLTPPPTRSPHTAPSSAPVSPTLPAGAIPLPPDQNGYVFIENKSGVTRCQISTTNVGCEAPFTHSPIQNGEHANGVNITANGSVQWVLGNLGAIPTVTVDYKV